MSTKKSKNHKNKQFGALDDKFELTNAASSGECTGLMPTLVQNEEEAEAYQEIYSFRPPAAVLDEQDSHKQNPDERLTDVEQRA